MSEVFEHWIETPIYPAFVRVRGGAPASLVGVTEPVVSIPPGMSVDGVRLLLLRLTRGVSEGDSTVLEFGTAQQGGPETGEYLLSLGFEGPAGFMSVASRDEDALKADDIRAEWAEYTGSFAGLAIRQAPPKATVAVAVAWHLRGEAAIEDEDIWTWFAVDAALPG